MPPRQFISRFSPNRTNPEILEQIFVQRRDLLEQSVAVLRESALTENKHHLLFIGPRGCGKTHLLALIVYRLLKQPDLDDRLRIAWLNEDETSISFLDLMQRIYRALADRYPAEFPREDMEQLLGKDRSEALNLLSRNLLSRIGQRTVLVLVENLDTLFRQLDESDQRAWRSFIQNHPVFATAATAQSLFAGVSERDQPFFGFFDTSHLQPLTVEEAVELLRRISQLNQDTSLTTFLDTPRGKARVQAIHHLSGGNHRLYIVLSDFMTRESLDELVGPFEQMVDEQLTPYYQERLRWLSPQQRKIVEFLCLRGRPVPVKEIAAALFAEHGSIASQLQKLRELGEMGYVRATPRGRESLYELAEPLMRLSMEVKSTGSHQPLRVIVDFLRVWFEREELEQLSTRCDSAGLGLKYLSAALEKLQPGQPDLRRELLLQGIEDLDIEHCDLDQLERLRLLAEDSDEPNDWMKCILACWIHQRLPEGVQWAGKVIESSHALPGQVALAFAMRGYFLRFLGKTEEAIVDCARAIESPGAPPEVVAMVLLERGDCLFSLGRTKEAAAECTRAIESPSASPDVAGRALLCRGACLGTLGRTEEAIADFARAIDSPSASADVLARALVYRAGYLGPLGRREEAIADCARATNVPGASGAVVAGARGLLALLRLRGGEWDGATEQLGKFLACKQMPADVVAQVTGVLPLVIFDQIASPEVWRALARETVSLYARHDALPHIGEALVRHLSELSKSTLNSDGLDQWLAGWESAASDHGAMQVPLRLLRTGIAYLKTQPRDEGILLQLPSEERRLVRLALGLAEESSQ